MNTIVRLALLAAVLAATESSLTKPPLFMDVVKIRAVIGRDAIIPCGQKKIFLDGPEAYVSWMKNDREMIYRFPLSNTNQDGYSTSNEICYKDPDVSPCRERTSLFLPRVSHVDSGEYRCRIHYQASPSIDYTFELIIVDKPGFPTVFDEDGNTMINTFVGPIPLGANVTLICEVKDDRSNTVVYWEKNGELYQPAVTVAPNLKRGILRIINASRDEHETRYSCISQAGDVTEPLKNTLDVRMYLPPLSVNINLNERYEFEAGTPRVLDCIVVGSVPAPTIHWYLDDNPLKIYSHKESPGLNVTLSTMTFTPKRSDDNRILSCRASNPYFKDVFTSSIRLAVGYKPICVQTLKQKLNIQSNKIEKVLCFVDAVPPPVVFTWNFSNYKSVETPVEATDIPFRFKSVLSWIPHDEDIGKLRCSATNVHGKQEEPCLFDLLDKAYGHCPPGRHGEGCTHGESHILLGSSAPKLNGHSLTGGASEATRGEEFRFSSVWKEVLTGVVCCLLGLVVLFALCRHCGGRAAAAKRPHTHHNDSRHTFSMEEEESATYYRGPELEHCPVHSTALVHLGSMSTRVESSSSGTSPHPSRQKSPTRFTHPDIQSFYV